MKLYLSSYKLGNEIEKLTKMIKGNKRIAVISNSLDCYSDLERRKQGDLKEIKQLEEHGIKPEVLDLRDYFGKKEKLELILKTFNGLWVRGGNTFVLRIAMKKSGLDEILQKGELGTDFVYAGYSAGCCVLAPSIKGFENVDDPKQTENAYPNEKLIWEGLGLIDFVFVPHYKSDHPESAYIDEVIEYLEKNNISYEPFSDGEVYINETKD